VAATPLTNRGNARFMQKSPTKDSDGWTDASPETEASLA
jgi:hypothetical protein